MEQFVKEIQAISKLRYAGINDARGIPAHQTYKTYFRKSAEAATRHMMRTLPDEFKDHAATIKTALKHMTKYDKNGNLSDEAPDKMAEELSKIPDKKMRLKIADHIVDQTYALVTKANEKIKERPNGDAVSNPIANIANGINIGKALGLI